MNREPMGAASGAREDGLHLEVVNAAGGEPVRLVVAGELDRCSAAQLRDTIVGIVRDQAPVILQIDAGGISFLDSSGIQCLLMCRADAQTAGSRLVLVDPAPVVAQVLEITGLLEIFGLPVPAVPTVWRRATTSGDIVRSHGPVPMQELLAQSAAIRQAARQTRERAEAMRRDDSLRRLRLGMP
ncbi:STAS domain-containing protein [Paractinoplanes hotanensis]|uniref:STAS domain-containing protein n=1 Tax=Paractinoplanes hotanensis TaxID=2906497 RepID=A0ABT0XWT6_9ACTN|nr:STAS domain-containing protein [Actinoplanes hotanensis]MCM4078253.1 STAS domain-containing protein [Actinoplanes hotanensis]